MASPKVGADVESMCGKCGDVWHIIVAMVEGKIVKVECKECDAQHKYKPPPGKDRVDAMTNRTSARASSTRTTTPRAPRTPGSTSSIRRPRADVINPPLVEPDMSRPIKDYVITEYYRVAERIQHSKFGQGIVEKDLGDNKIQVYFADGRRTLMHGK